jgi:hypothetical protein
LREVLERVDQAEQRAKEAEERARAAEEVAASSVRATDEVEPRPPRPAEPAPEPSAEAPPSPWPSPPPAPNPVREAETGPPNWIIEPEEEEAAGKPAADQGWAEDEEAETWEPERQEEPLPPPEPAAPGDPDAIELNGATFEQLRDLGFSVTQATRVITNREGRGGFASLDDLDGIPGIPRDFLDDVKARLKL